MTNLNTNSENRQVGFEIEFADVPLKDVAGIIQRQLGGEIEQQTSAVWLVKDTSLGLFTLEIDANPIKKAASAFTAREDINDSFVGRVKDKISTAANTMVDTIGARIAPLEIVGPPVKISQIHEMDKLRDALRNESALGTNTSFHHAFGLHINPEAPSLETESILRHIQAFSLLYERLLDLHRVDMARRLSTYISSYPDKYVDMIVAEDYEPDLSQLIKDYHAHNPSRNQALDMLPLFSHLENELVRDLYGHDEKINARPTYHYRLPNSEIDSASWSLEKEWQRWLLVEEVAENKSCLEDLKNAWRNRDSSSIARAVEGEEEWKRVVTSILEKHDVRFS